MASKTPPEKATRDDIRRFKANLDDEIDGIAIYQMLARAEKDPERRQIFEELAVVEQGHAEVWRKALREAGVEPHEHGPSLRTRALGLLANVFGPRAILPIVRNMESGAYLSYMGQGEAGQAIAPDEKEHRRTVARLAKPGADPVETIAARETWHRSGGGGTLRASVFGVSDGLVSNASLVMGFAGAQADGKFVLLAGIAGLLGGAFSMAAGEYVSMQAQRELFERQIELERDELAMAPEEERKELVLIYQAKGLPREQAQEMAARMMENPQIALDTLVREELGLDPSQLGSPWGAAIGSFLAFAGGALVPVIPFFFSSSASTLQVGIAAAMSGLALFGVGASLSLFTGRSSLWSGTRQLSLGIIAAALTYGIGRLVGVSTGV